MATSSSYKYTVCDRERMSELQEFVYNKRHQNSLETTREEEGGRSRIEV